MKLHTILSTVLAYTQEEIKQGYTNQSAAMTSPDCVASRLQEGAISSDEAEERFIEIMAECAKRILQLHNKKPSKLEIQNVLQRLSGAA